MDEDIKKEIAEIICQAWNELNASLFESILSKDFEYTSLWALETIKGKDRYMEYITGQFESIRKENNPVSAEILFQEVIDQYVVVLIQGDVLVVLEPKIQDNMLRSLWERPIDMVIPTTFTSNRTYYTNELHEEKHETEYGRFSSLFLEALMSKEFSKIDDLLAEDVIQILYDNNEIIGKEDVISYWTDWLEKWNELNEDTIYRIKHCKYYDREILSIEPRHKKVLYQIARLENGKAKQMILCPNPQHSYMLRYWDLDRSPLLFENLSAMPHRMGKDLEAHPYRIPCMRCGCKSEKLQWYEYKHDAGGIRYSGELSVWGNCMEAVEFLPIFYAVDPMFNWNKDN